MRTDLRYTTNWTDVHTEDWRRILAPLIGRPFAVMAEIGCFEGRSSRWFVENILTGAAAALICYDTWAPHMADIEAHFDHNTADLQTAQRLYKVKAGSASLVTSFHSFDAIYVDGDHTTAQTLLDMCNAWQALKSGGILLVDDIHEYHEDKGIDILTAVTAFGACIGVDVEFTKAGDREQAVMRKPAQMEMRL